MPSSRQLPTLTSMINCGPPQVVGHPSAMTGAACARVHLVCDVESAALLPAKPSSDLLQILTYANGRRDTTVRCAVGAAMARKPRVTGAMARDEAEKLLPHPLIGTAPVGNVTLVNIETVFWLQTSADRVLGTVTLLGHRVTLRAHLQQVRWTFGDGATSTTSGPGKAYTRSDPCRSAQCPRYFGHTYRRTGQLTIGAGLTWSGQFRVDGGGWQPIAGTASAAATSQRIHVKQARGVLVPNP